MERLPGESCNDYHARLLQASRAQTRLDLQAARLEAESSGKQPFAYEAFLAAYNKISPNPPPAEEMELEYYLEHRSARDLNEFLAALWQKELHDGGDMHLDRSS